MAATHPVWGLPTCLTSEAALDRRVAILEGRQRPPEAVRPALARALSQYSLLRVEAVGRCWQEPPAPADQLALMDRAQGILAGCAASAAPLAFVLAGKKRTLSLTMGVRTRTDSDDAFVLQGLLQAHIPGVRTTPGTADCDLSWIDSLPCCHLIAGVPHNPPAEQGPPVREAAADRLARGLLYGGDWALVLLAEPLDLAHGDTLVDSWSATLEQAQLEFQQPGTMGMANRLAKLYVELLEVQLQRALVGRTQGNWLSQIYLVSETPAAAALVVAALAGAGSKPEPLQAIACPSSNCVGGSAVQQSTWLSSWDLANVVRHPLREYPGYAVEDMADFDTNPPHRTPSGAALSLGWIQDGNTPTGHQLQIDLDRLTGHALVAGTTDSGKTNTTFHLLEQLHDLSVPFLVIEPTKGEYRFLRQRFPDMHRITMGSNEAPLQANPFHVPPGVPVQAHVDYLLSLFAASFVLYAPMPHVLEAALHKVYVDKGWDLVNDVCWRDPARPPRAFPTLSDLYAAITPIVEGLGYETRIAQDVQAALHARINSLRVGNKGAALDTQQVLDVAALLKRPVVVEMLAIGDDEQKAFFIGLLLTMVFEHYQATGLQPAAVTLRHVTVVEEAHRLLQNVSQQQGGDFSNPRGKAVGTFANMIAEIRAYGEGFCIVEQSPVRLAPDVLKNTNLKMVHRIVAGEDRQALAAAMALGDAQQKALVSLSRGHVIALTSGMDRPMHVRIPAVKERLVSRDAAAPARPQVDVTPSLPAASLAGMVASDQMAVAFAAWCLTAAFGKPDEAQARRRSLVDTLRSCAPRALRRASDDQRWAAECVREAAEFLVSQLGSFYGWPFGDEEQLLQAITAAWAGQDTTQRLQDILLNGTTADIRPYPACDGCPHPCLFRLFAQQLNTIDGQADLARMVERYCQGLPGAERQLELQARFAARRVLPSSLEPMSSGLAACTLIDAFARAGAPAHTLAELIGPLRTRWATGHGGVFG